MYKKIFILGLIVLVLALPVRVLAVEAKTATGSANNTGASCVRTQAKLIKSSDRIKANRSLRAAFWKARMERWAAIVKTAKEWGLNTTKFEADMVTAEEKYNKALESVNTLVGKIDTLRASDCSQKEYKTNLVEMRNYHRNTVMSAFESFRVYLRDTVKVDLSTLLKEAKAVNKK